MIEFFLFNVSSKLPFSSSFINPFFTVPIEKDPSIFIIEEYTFS